MYCKVIFPNSYSNKKYVYETDITGLKEQEDYLVVPTNGTISLAIFHSYVSNEEALKMNSGKLIKHTIQKVDLTEHNKREANKKRQAEILKELEIKKKSFESMMIYKLMAETDQEVAKLLDELKELKDA